MSQQATEFPHNLHPKSQDTTPYLHVKYVQNKYKDIIYTIFDPLCVTKGCWNTLLLLIGKSLDHLGVK